LSIPGIEDSIGAFSYSEGGHLAEMLARFPKLDPNPKYLYRYDIHVYAENDTLVEVNIIIIYIMNININSLNRIILRIWSIG
jgi:hypothetical protein